MTNRNTFVRTLLAAGATALSASAMAYPSNNYTNMIPVSEAIAHPAYNANTGDQNPAGLVYNHGSRILADAQSGNTNLNNIQFGGDFLFGGGTWGGGLGVNVDPNATGGTSLTGTYGVAAHIQGLSTAIGIGGRTGLSNASGTTLNLGVLIAPYSPLTVGLTAYGLTGGIDGWGGGVGFELGHNAAFVVDATTNTKLDTFLLKPGLWVGNQKLGLTVSWGFDVGNGAAVPNPISGKDLSIGLNALLGRSINWQFCYQSIDKLYTSLTFDL
ncbi:MAG TPA: hypothetical protein VL588_10345 [Bdellovibrionota bacterium]|jgi:hypothetical protein|nr:hypothetical protein [Bdellovibrionota bacterium]